MPVARISALLVVVAAAAFYLPSLDAPPVWDDPIHLERARSGAVSFGSRVSGEYLRPLVSESFRLQVETGTASPTGLHAFNIVLHALNAFLVMALALRLGAPLAVAAAGTAAFALHPLQSGAVAYISGRTDLLAYFFVLLACHGAAFFAAGMRQGAGAAAKAAGLLAAVVALAASAAAVLSKESGVVAGPLAAAVVWHSIRRPDEEPSKASRSIVAFMVAAVLVCIGAFAWVRPPALAEGLGISIVDRLSGAGTALRTYAALVVSPTDLHMDRLARIEDPNAFAWGVGWLAASAAVVAVFALRPGRLALAAFAAVVAYVPAAGFIPVYPHISSEWVFAGEHLLYPVLAPLALFGVGAATGWFYRHGVSRWGNRISFVAGCAVAVLSVAPVWARQKAFEDPETLYQATLQHSPSPRACFNLGVHYIENGKYEEARLTYEHCLESSPEDARMHAQLGVAYQKLGKRNLAEISYARALEFDAEDPRIWSNYASLDATWGYFDDAREKWLHALELDADFAPAREGLKKLAIVERQRSQRANGGSN